MTIKKKHFIIILAIIISLSLISCIHILNNDNKQDDLLINKTYDEFITIDVFCSQANYQGLQSGWFAKVVKDKFNMALNIIAPNVAGGGDTLFQTRSAAGNLGDLVMINSSNGRLEDTITAGLLMDMAPYLEQMPHVNEFQPAIEMIQKLLGDDTHFYAMPSSVSNSTVDEPSETLEPVYGPYLRWDLYTAIGSPRITTLENLLPVLKAMQYEQPTSESGQATYAFSSYNSYIEITLYLIDKCVPKAYHKDR